MPQTPTAKKPTRKLLLSVETIKTLVHGDLKALNRSPTATCNSCASRPCRTMFGG